ncbi:MAG: C4-dicarboxylic acid transporter DauA [Oligoflexia bacterium]|nr:C4-dicarboxylic acid transporter DauA [Oligoflexia bacterium]
MPPRYIQPLTNLLPLVRLRPFAAIREKLSEGYSFADLRCDLMAGAVVGMVAIPLGMALAIASGVPPQHGLYTVIVGGAIIALLGGSRLQVSGPTAAFVVILAPIAHEFGLGGLLVAGMMAGLMLILLGVARMGRMIQFIPYPVTTGFTAGIAVVIATLQLKDFFGLRVAEMPERFLEKVLALFGARGTASGAELAIGALTLAILLLWPRINKRVPAPLVALTAASLLGVLARRVFPELEFATIGSRFTYETGGVVGHGIPQALPHLNFPWSFSGPGGAPLKLSLETIEALVPPAFAIAMLGAIESLLSAVVADGMAQTKHDPDAELVALGTGNLVCPFFGGIAATGAIARTATNIRYGAKSPFSAVFHSIFALLVVVLLAQYVSYLPMAALAALLMLVAYNMSEVKHFVHILKVAPKSDVIVLLTCFFLTVLFDMVVGVTVGVVLAALLFMKRMAAVTSAQLVQYGTHPQLKEPLPKEILLYDVAGPLFFGAAEQAANAISGITDDVRVVIFLMEGVPAMDVTGLVAFESAIAKLTRHERLVYLTGIKPQPLELLRKGDLLTSNSRVRFCETVDEAVRLGKKALADGRGSQESISQPGRNGSG